MYPKTTSLISRVQESPLRLVIFLCLINATIITFVVGCGSEREESNEPSPRPVAVIELKNTNPSRSLRLTGSTEAWKEEDLNFEVDGRVEWVIEPGRYIEGRTFDENGNIITHGDVLARLDRKKYLLRVDQAKAEVEYLEALAEALKIEIEQVVAQQIKEAQVNRDLALKNYKRFKTLYEEETVAEITFDKTKAQFDAAQARLEQVKATKQAKKAELISTMAQIKSGNETLKQALLDLEHCELISPFHGQVARTNVIPGGYAQPGQPVATVVMMDPIKVEVSVSPETDRNIHYNDLTYIYLPDWDEPIEGIVWLKDTVADPRTRTFRITHLVRNRKVSIELPDDPELQALPKVNSLVRLHRVEIDKTGPYYVGTDALFKDDEGYYVWKVENLQARQLTKRYNPVLRLKKVRVVPGEKRFALVGLYHLRELIDTGGLGGVDIITSEPDREIKDGDRVLFSRERWLLRPGDLVQVEVLNTSTQDGFYVPMAAIIPIDEKTGHVFIVDNGSVRKIPVKLFENVGDLFRIEAAEDNLTPFITEGTQLISKNVHFLVPGEPVRVVKTEKIKP